MYSSFSNQMYNFAHFLIAFLLVGVFWPRYLFAKEGTTLENFFARYSKMMVLLIILGYVLVLTKLYELISLVVILLVITFHKYLQQNDMNFYGWINKINIIVYDFFDGIFQPRRLLSILLSRKKIDLINRINTFYNVSTICHSILFLCVFLYTAYLRFYDAFTHAAPAMSDAYVTLAWLKYIGQRILFHDGIYPQGFHIFLSILHKFAAVDHLYVLRYTGPLNGVLIALSLYFFVLHITGNKSAGIVAVLIFGVFGQYLPNEWERQASTNSQEFGFVFILPGWYFVLRYLKDPTLNKLYTAFAPILLTGLVHTLAFAFVALGVGLLLLTALMNDFRKSITPVMRIVTVGIIAGLISALPAVIGLLLGKGFHDTTASFLLETIAYEIIPPALGITDNLAMTGMLLFCFVRVIDKQTRQLSFEFIFIFLIGLVSFFLYYYGGVLTRSTLISARSSELWALVSAVIIGLGWYSLTRILVLIKLKKMEIMISFILFFYSSCLFKPDPIMPYKMERDAAIEQYFKISSTLRPTEWLIVSQEEGYAVALGNGYHLMMEDFLEYDPNGKRLVRWVNNQAMLLDSPDTFIFHEKRVFEVSVFSGSMDLMDPIIQRRKNENQELVVWLKEYKKYHNNLSIFYEDENLQVLRIHQPPSKKEQNRIIWYGE